ncbi:haloacid dehalogenase, partial [Xanthomonas citri pv. citri]|nr:haloacid dehalogenase [Xanthomonas citri pv. citri]
MNTTFFDGHDGLLCDLDGVVYAGGGAIAGAVETLSTLQEQGVPVGFVTNNASRAPESVAEHLRTLG